MTKSEYKKSIEDLEQKYKQDKKLLAIRFATSNNPHSVGDIIEDHSTKIRVQKMTVSLGVLNRQP